MVRKFISHLTYANVMATVAVFIAIGGGAYAAGLAKNSVGSKQIKDGKVKGIDVKDDSLTGTDVDESTLSGVPSTPGGPAGGDLTGTYPNPQIASNAVGSAEVAGNSLSGADIDESSLGQVPIAALGGIGRSVDRGTTPCDPGSGTYIDCGFTTLNLPTATRVQMTASFRIFGGGVGSCRLATSSGAVADEVVVGGDQFVPLTTVTGIVGPGAVDFGLECRQASGNIVAQNINVSAVALSPN